MALNLSRETLEQVTNSPIPVIIDVYATWCGPCQMMKPIFEQLAQEYQGKYLFAELNVDEFREQAIALNVSSVPTFIFMKDGKVVGRETGYMSKEKLVAKITEFVG